MNKKKILIVDDEPDFVNLVRVRLEANGYEVIDASNGEEGIKKAEEERPDIILLDIMMPKKDGYTLMRELKYKETTKSIPIIALTGKPKMKDLFEIEGIKDYVVKPFEDEDLLLRIKKALTPGRGNGQKENFIS